MDKPEKKENGWEKFKDKLNNLSWQKKLLFFLYIGIIYLTIFWLYNQDSKQIIEYKDVSGEVMCKEIYINGILNSTPCPDRYKNKGNRLNDGLINMSKINITQ